MRLRQRWKWPVVAAAAVVLAGGGTAYAVTGGEEAPDYRTVTAGRGDVEQTLSLTGLVDAAHRSDLAFGTDGTVASVKVEQGERVQAGQVIAVLATQTLDAAVTEAESTLASAKAQLESDQEAQTSSVQDANDTGDTGGGVDRPGDETGGPDPKTQAALKKLKEQQRAVLAAQSAASAAITAAKEALAAQTQACADAYAAPEEPGDGEIESPADAASDDACAAALADVQAKQVVVAEAQDALATALTDLTKTLSAALGDVAQQQAQQQARQEARATAEAPTTQQPEGASNGSTGGTVTAARLAADQAAIDQAQADLVSARAARSQATLRATRTGTVASLTLAEGDTVTTGTAVGVVIGGKAVTLTGTVSESQVGSVKVGQKARVSVPGSDTTTEGTVTAIGMTADSSSGTTSYPVTITVEDPAIALPTGSRAQVSIVLATAEDVVTLPISAITRTGAGAVVRVRDGNGVDRTAVTLGAVGARTVEVTDGIETGDEVVLADADQAISGASSELNERGGFGPGGGGPPVVFRQGGPGGGTVSLAR